MFSNSSRLEQRTPKGGINRKEFIAHLVEEYHTTTNIEAQEQVTANLANFAYDPINWQFLKDSETLELFLNVLSTPNENLQLHGLAGLCNICYDPESFEFISDPKNFPLIGQLFLKTTNKEIILNSLTLFYQLLSENSSRDLKLVVASPQNLKRIHEICKEHADDLRIYNVAKLFCEDFGSRSETIELPATNATRNAKSTDQSPLQ